MVFHLRNLQWPITKDAQACAPRGQFSKPATAQATGTPFVTNKINDLTVNLFHPEGGVRQGDNEILIEFRNAGGELVDVGNVKFEVGMNMPGMVMRAPGGAEKTGTPGQYRAKTSPNMAGDWTAKLSYEGPAGRGESSFAVPVR